MYPVFISHSSHDAEFANRICDILEKKGVPCWIAPRNVRPGHDYGVEILDGIEQSRALILILSKNSNKSKFVKREIERAVSRGKTVLPLRIDDISPSKGLELFISDTHWIDVWTPPIEQYLDRVIKAIYAISPYGSPETTLRGPFVQTQQPSQEPASPPKQKKKRAPRLLITGLLLLTLFFAALKFIPLSKLLSKDEAVSDSSSSGGSNGEKPGPSPNPGKGGNAHTPVPAPPTSEPVTPAPPPADISSILTLLHNSYGEERSQKLHQYESRLPEKLTLSQIRELIYFSPGGGDLDVPRYFREVTWLKKRLPKAQKSGFQELRDIIYYLKTKQRTQMIDLLWEFIPDSLSATEALTLIGHSPGNGSSDAARYLKELTRFKSKLPATLTAKELYQIVYYLYSSQRSQALTVLWEKIPASLNSSEITGLIGHRPSNGAPDAPRYLKELTRFHSKFPETLSTKELYQIVYYLYAAQRSKALTILWEKIPASLEASEASNLIGHRPSNGAPDAPRYLDELTRFEPKLNLPLTFNEINIFIYYLYLENRSKAIAILSKKIPEKLSVDQFIFIAGYRRNNQGTDVTRYQGELNAHQHRLPPQLTAGEMTKLVGVFGGKARRDWILFFAPRLETLTASEATQLTRYLGSTPEGKAWEKEVMDALLPKIR